MPKCAVAKKKITAFYRFPGCFLRLRDSSVAIFLKECVKPPSFYKQVEPPSFYKQV